MSLRIRRRRFGQLAVASAAATAIANLAGKAVAQQSPSAIYGVSLSTVKALTDVGNLVSSDINNIANTAPAITLISSDVDTGKQLSTLEIATTTVNNLTTSIEAAGKAISRQPQERITGLTTLSDGTLITASVVNSSQGNVNRLIFNDTKSSKAQKALKVSGFKKSNSTVENLLAIKDDTLIAVVSLNGGTPPFELVTIDRNTGIINSSNDLALPDLLPFLRLSNLAQSSDGTIYATTLGPQGVTTLVQLDLTNKSLITGKGRIINVSRLTLNNKPLQNDLLSFAFSPSGVLFGLANPNSQGTNSLYTVDVKTANVTLLRGLAVDKIAFLRS